MWLRSRELYNPVCDDDEKEDNSRPNVTPSSKFWPICSAFLLGICFFLLFLLWRESGCTDYVKGQYASSKTDFKSAISAIEYHQVQFGGIILTEGAFKITGGASTRPYVGTSYREIDESWDDILEKRWFNLTADEKRTAFGNQKSEEYLDFVQLDTFHLLHCINHLRKIIDADFYYPNGLPPLRIHTDHCLDVLRESVQCHGDLTLIPYRPDKSTSYYYSDSIQVHTCRNFDALRHWLVDKRDAFSIDPFKLE